jgi:hypothetical protein
MGAICCALLFIATPIALVTYFNRAWRKVGSVPNRAAYVIWLGVETVAAVGILAIIACAVIILAVARQH